MRRRTAAGICHWNVMMFAGQGVAVVWRELQPDGIRPDRALPELRGRGHLLSHQLLTSFLTRSTIWTNTRDYASYASVTALWSGRIRFPSTRA
jgi:hypothetical protein